MSWIKELAQQVRQDLVQEVLKRNDYESIREITQNKKHADKFFEEVVGCFKPLVEKPEIVKVLTQHYKNAEEVIQKYCHFGHEEVYKDALNSAAFSRRLNHFLFTTRAKGFGLDERSRFSNRLRKEEDELRKAESISRECKREFQELLDAEFYNPGKVRPCISKYLTALSQYLKSKAELYDIERTMLKMLQVEINRNLLSKNPDMDEKKIRAYKKAVAQLVPALQKRGMDTPKVHLEINPDQLAELQTSLDKQVKNLLAQNHALKTTHQFINQVSSGMGIQVQ